MAPETPLVAACAECIETTIPAIAGIAAAASLIRRFRSIDGRLRVDFDKISMLTNPATGEQILLDHLAQVARILRPPAIPGLPPIPGLQIPGIPGIPGMPALPALPLSVNPEALGKLLIEGLLVEGVRHVFAAVNGILPPITSWELWTNTKLQMPVFSQTIGAFGIRTCICKCTPIEPPASTFQIPSAYTLVHG